MFKLVYIIQCESTGEFLTPRLNYTWNFNLAGRFDNKQSAIDTAFNEFDTDFMIYEFYVRAN